MGVDTVTPAWLWEPRSTTAKHVAAYPATITSSAANSISNNSSSSTNNQATNSSSMRRKSSATRLPLRKSMSDAIGASSSSSSSSASPSHHQQSQLHQFTTYQTSASLRSVLAADHGDQSADCEQTNDLELALRRQQIMQRAEEIQRGARHVGMQFGETCPVCLADDVDAQLTQCGHRIHAKCIKRWIQSGTRCPVCREQVTGVQEAFTPPSRAYFGALQKDREPSASASDDASTSLDEGDDECDFDDEQDGNDNSNGGFEWGWFEDFDEFDELNDDSVHAGLSARRASLPNLPSAGSNNYARSRSGSGSHSALLNREMSGAFEICRTFPPLRAVYDAPYAVSRHAWMRVLPSHRHIAAKIQIRSFRIVEARASRAQHAEYLVELQLDGRYFSRWRRFSAISRFVSTIGSSEFRETHAAWSKLEAASRWFNRLELGYLHERCKLLEQFAHTLLIECSTAHPLADLLDA